MTLRVLSLCLLALASSAAAAQEPSPVVLSVQKAIDGNPGVAAKFEAYRAASEEIGATAGAWLPHLDVSAEAGQRSYTAADLVPSSPTYFEGGARLTLSQLLWDGLATSKEVERLSHARLLRYFEFAGSAQQVGLDAATAWFDVVRHRRLLALAQENYVQHRVTFDQVESRVDAGVGRGVDLEQVRARVALVQSSLVDERAALHDVTERYLRIVGALPPAQDESGVPAAMPLPATPAAALEEAAMRSPLVAAAIENLRAARAAAEGRRAAYQPRVEARVSAADGHNLDGQVSERKDASAAIVLTWNVFNGGSDVARERQFVRLLDQAQDLRDQACNDVRETVGVAFNDVRRLEEQTGYLARNVASIRKARDAYRQQFDIGQRSLLDLLNSENELYTAERNLAEAQEDHAIAIVRVFAGIGTLAQALGLGRPDHARPAPEGQQWSAGGDASSRCPLVPVDMAGAATGELDRRAREIEAARAQHHPSAGQPPVTDTPR